MSESAVVDEYTVTGDDVGSKPETFVVTLPSKADNDAIVSLHENLSFHIDVHGVKSLRKWIEKYQYHTNLASEMWERATRSTDVVNGVRTPLQRGSDKKRSLQSTAEMFYGSLSTPVLRTQCKAFNLDYDSYDSVEDIVAALVAASVEVAA